MIYIAGIVTCIIRVYIVVVVKYIATIATTATIRVTIIYRRKYSCSVKVSVIYVTRGGQCIAVI